MSPENPSRAAQKSSPAFACGVENISPVEEVAGNKYSGILLNNNQVKIQPHNSGIKSKKYWVLLSLSKKEYNFQTSLRHTHPSTGVNNIISSA